MWRWLSVLCTLLVLLILAVPANADTWYRGALLRHSLEPPYRSQLDDSIYARSDCGPAVLGMVLADYGVDEDTLELRRLTHTYQGTWPTVRVGTALQHVAHVAEDFGLSAYGLYDEPDGFHQWTVEEVFAQVGAAHLVIPLVRFGLLPGHEDCDGGITSCCTPRRATASCIRTRPCGRSNRVAPAGSVATSWTEPWRRPGRGGKLSPWAADLPAGTLREIRSSFAGESRRGIPEGTRVRVAAVAARGRA